MRKLIVNADDFGLTTGVNRAIVEAHRHGVVTSATLMANAPAFDHAVALSGDCAGLSVGCHVVLVDGEPLLPVSQVKTLVDETGRLRNSLANFYTAAMLGRIREEEIEGEVIAQVERLQRAGVRVSHLDTHKHTHMLPVVLRPLLHAARRCGVGAVRNPFEPTTWSLPRGQSSLWKRWIEVRMLRVFAGEFRKQVQTAGIATPAAASGVVVTGALTAELFRKSVRDLPDGVSEFVCHPGHNDEELEKVHTRLRSSREQELRILTAPETRMWLDDRGFQLVSYTELQAH